MKTSGRYLAAVVMMFVITGCARERQMHALPASAMPPQPAADKAVVVFMQPSPESGAVALSLFELRPDGDRFLGILRYKQKVAYVAEPGRARFMGVSQRAAFLDAELEAGKTYYIVVLPQTTGAAWFSLHPIRGAEIGGMQFQQWSMECTLVENTDASRRWARENSNRIQHKKAADLPKWEQATNRPALRKEDGR
jgi:hypothetical protein